jgi:predicted porin
LGTTALIAVTMAPQIARADDQPVKLGISGILQFGYGAAVSESEKSSGTFDSALGVLPQKVSSNRLPDGAKTYANLDISGDSKFKNGITAGAFIEFSAQPIATGSNGGTTTQVKQDWVHLMGDSFGEVRFGDYTDARRAKGLAAPTWSPNFFFGANSPDITFIGNGALTNTTTAWMGNRYMTELAWFSPTFDGAQLSLSYAPDNGNFSNAGPGTYGPGNSTAVTSANGTYTVVGGPGSFGSGTFIRDVVSAALTWSGTVKGFTVTADGGFTSGQSKKVSVGTISANPFIWDGGVTVAWGPWNVGAVYEQTANLLGNYGGGLNNGEINKTIDVGATYTIGNLTAGVEWSRGIYEGGAATPAGLDPKAHFTLDTITPGASYVIGPGVDIDAGIQYNLSHGQGWDATGATAAPTGSQYRGSDTVFEFGTEVKF